MRYKVGDKITIKSRNKINKTLVFDGYSYRSKVGNYSPPFNQKIMYNFCGRTYIVKGYKEDCYLIFDERYPNSCFVISKNWIEPLSKKIEKIMQL